MARKRLGADLTMTSATADDPGIVSAASVGRAKLDEESALQVLKELIEAGKVMQVMAKRRPCFPAK
jgi:hypothetical protein